MTSKYWDTTGIDLYRIGETTLCNIMDVIKLIQHEIFEASTPEVLDVLDRIEARVAKNDFISQDAKEPVRLDGVKLPEKEQEEIPGRYAVGRENKDGWEFIAGTNGDIPLLTRNPGIVQLFVAYRDASAYVDFLDEEGWRVIDWENAMTEEKRWIRDLRTPFPYDLDDGLENAIPVKAVKKK